MGSSDLIIIAAIGGGLLLFGKPLMANIQKMIDQMSQVGAGGDAGAGAGDQTQQQAEQPAATATSTTNIIAPTPLGAYPLGYIPYAGYPYGWPTWPQFPPVLGYFSEPRRFNNWPRFPGPWVVVIRVHILVRAF